MVIASARLREEDIEVVAELRRGDPFRKPR
jgi:hypothetical protein